MTADYIFTAVCQSGVFEIKALLLAASFSQHNKANAEFVLGIPEGDLSPITVELIEKLNLSTINIETPIKNYPISNKLAVFKEACHIFEGSNHIFMDTDMLWLRPFEGIPNVSSYDVHIRPGGENSVKFYKSSQDWAPIYALFGLPAPTRTIQAFESDVQILPYFNAGFVCTNRGKTFSDSWLHTSKIIDADPRIKHTRPWLDQLSLPVCCELNKLNVGSLDHRLNAPNRIGKKYADWQVNHYSLLSSLVRQKTMTKQLISTFKMLPKLSDLAEELYKKEVIKTEQIKPKEIFAGENRLARAKKNLQEIYDLKTAVSSV